MNIQTAFDIGDRVHIDGCPSIVGVITSIEVRRSDLIRYEVSWVDAGNAQFVVFDEWRLSTIGVSKYPEHDREKYNQESVDRDRMATTTASVIVKRE